jgi:hypothetical protein
MSKDPIPKERAMAQMRALYASERQRGKKLKGGAMNLKVLTNMIKFWFGILQRRPNGEIYRKIPSESNLRSFFQQLLHQIGNEYNEGRYSKDRHDKLIRRITRIRDKAITEFNDATRTQDLGFIPDILKLHKLFQDDSEPPVEEVEDEVAPVPADQMAHLPAGRPMDDEEEEEEEEEEEDEDEDRKVPDDTDELEHTPTSPTSPSARHTFDAIPPELLRLEAKFRSGVPLTPAETAEYHRLRKTYRGHGYRGKGHGQSKSKGDGRLDADLQAIYEKAMERKTLNTFVRLWDKLSRALTLLNNVSAEADKSEAGRERWNTAIRHKREVADEYFHMLGIHRAFTQSDVVDIRTTAEKAPPRIADLTEQIKALREKTIVPERYIDEWGLRGGGVWDYFTEQSKKLLDEALDYASKSTAGKIAKATKTITEAFTPDSYAPSTRSWLDKNGRGHITDMKVVRTPVAKGLETFFTLLTLGKYDKAKQASGYDKMFHLSILVKYQMPNGEMRQGVLHKVEKVEYTSQIDRAVQADSEYMSVPIGKPLTLHEFVKTGKTAMGNTYFRYSAFRNNCQDFIGSMLKANGLLTPSLSAFIYQPVNELIQHQPDYTEDVALTLTNLGGIWNRVMEGYGKKSAERLTPLDPFKTQLEKAGLSPSAYLNEARRRATKFGYPSKLLGFADDTEHKLQIPDKDGRVVRFGKAKYGDHLLYSHLEKEGKVSSGTAEKKRQTFQKSHSQIKGQWKSNDFSPNNLALRILW